MRKPIASDKILKALLSCGGLGKYGRGLTKYEIYRKSKLSHGRIHETMKKLEKEELVVSEVKGKAPTGLKIKCYSLTPLGAITAIGKWDPKEDGSILDSRDMIAQSISHIFPMIFDHWETFKQNKVDEIIFFAFIHAASLEYSKISSIPSSTVLVKDPNALEKPISEIAPNVKGSFTVTYLEKILSSITEDTFLDALTTVQAGYTVFENDGRQYLKLINTSPERVAKVLSDIPEVRELVIKTISERKRSCLEELRIYKRVETLFRAGKSRSARKP